MTTFTAGSLADGQLASSVGAIYTVPALTVAYLKSLSLYNSNAADQTILVYIHRSGSTRRVYRRLVLSQYQSADVISPGTSIQLSAGDTIDAVTTTASAVDYVVTGVQEA